MFVAVAAVVVAIVGVTAYFERSYLKAELKTLVAKAEVVEKSIASKITAAELNLRGRITQDARRIVSDIKAWESKESASAKDVIAQFEARLKQIL